MYFGEPSSIPASVMDDDGTRATPKSVIFAIPAGETMMFAGLMSRCTMPKRPA
jgi:hypothetical protein